MDVAARRLAAESWSATVLFHLAHDLLRTHKPALHTRVGVALNDVLETSVVQQELREHLLEDLPGVVLGGEVIAHARVEHLQARLPARGKLLHHWHEVPAVEGSAFALFIFGGADELDDGRKRACELLLDVESSVVGKQLFDRGDVIGVRGVVKVRERVVEVVNAEDEGAFLRGQDAVVLPILESRLNESIKEVDVRLTQLFEVERQHLVRGAERSAERVNGRSELRVPARDVVCLQSQALRPKLGEVCLLHAAQVHVKHLLELGPKEHIHVVKVSVEARDAAAFHEQAVRLSGTDHEHESHRIVAGVQVILEVFEAQAERAGEDLVEQVAVLDLEEVEDEEELRGGAVHEVLLHRAENRFKVELSAAAFGHVDDNRRGVRVSELLFPVSDSRGPLAELVRRGEERRWQATAGRKSGFLRGDDVLLGRARLLELGEAGPVRLEEVVENTRHSVDVGAFDFLCDCWCVIAQKGDEIAEL
mmetsp:Transcript_19920/g.63886  ORF Transcript_19920/g.63886 Transcript_19920/m.63886 type:complete len:478 (+) Transcript_19920:275-1708(+)